MSVHFCSSGSGTPGFLRSTRLGPETSSFCEKSDEHSVREQDGHGPCSPLIRAARSALSKLSGAEASPCVPAHFLLNAFSEPGLSSRQLVAEWTTVSVSPDQIQQTLIGSALANFAN